MAAGNPEHLQNLATFLHSLDLQGDIRRIAAATFPTAANLDLNGACLVRWGKEANQCYDELTAAIFTNTMA
jgi:hypothetical protein